LVSRNLVKPTMELYSQLPTKRLSDAIEYLTNLAKSKYKVDMGDLFRLRFRDIQVGDYLTLGSASVITKIRLEPNDAAFEAIDRSKAQENNSLVRDVTEVERILKNITKSKYFDWGVADGEPTIEWKYSEDIEGDIYKFTMGLYTLENPEDNKGVTTYLDIDFTVNDSNNLINKGVFSRAKRMKLIATALLTKSSRYTYDYIRIMATDEQGNKKETQRLALYKRAMEQLGYTNPEISEDGEVLFYQKPNKGIDIEKESNKIQQEGNYIINSDGDIAVPTSLPQINIQC